MHIHTYTYARTYAVRIVRIVRLSTNCLEILEQSSGEHLASSLSVDARLAIGAVVEHSVHIRPRTTYLPHIILTMISRASNYWKLCVILAAVAGGTRGWQVGSGHKYKLTNTLIFREAEPPKSAGNVGFRLTGELDITALWQDSNDPNVFLLKFEV